MKEKTFQKKISRHKYQVFIFKSKLPKPVNFATHSWFVIVKNKKITRWEVYGHEQKNGKKWGHVYKNSFEPIQGLKKKIFSKKHNNSSIIGKVQGGTDSLANKMVNFIEKESSKYVNAGQFHYVLGPNCNTYVQWVLDRFPECKIKLPKSAIGKDYHTEE